MKPIVGAAALAMLFAAQAAQAQTNPTDDPRFKKKPPAAASAPAKPAPPPRPVVTPPPPRPVVTTPVVRPPTPTPTPTVVRPAYTPPPPPRPAATVQPQAVTPTTPRPITTLPNAGTPTFTTPRSATPPIQALTPGAGRGASAPSGQVSGQGGSQVSGQGSATPRPTGTLQAGSQVQGAAVGASGASSLQGQRGQPGAPRPAIPVPQSQAIQGQITQGQAVTGAAPRGPQAGGSPRSLTGQGVATQVGGAQTGVVQSGARTLPTRPGGSTGRASGQVAGQASGQGSGGTARSFATRPGGGSVVQGQSVLQGQAAGQASARTGGGRSGAAPARQPGWRVAGAPGQAPSRSASRNFTYRGQSYAAFRSAPYRFPLGFRPQRYGLGELLPLSLLISDYFINDYRFYGLAEPPAGEEWVRVGPDALLVDGRTGLVADTAPAAFDESLPPTDDPGPSADGGDAPPPPPQSLDPSLPRAFSEGTFRLGASGAAGCQRFYSDARVRDDLDDSWMAEDWNGVARKVMDQGCRTDLSYYLLGLSAEALGQNRAAQVYYNGAIALTSAADPDAYATCRQWRDDPCRGVSVLAESRAGLDRITGGR